jgi:hypothetical protein
MKPRTFFFAAILAASWILPVAAQTPQIQVTANRNRIYLGEAVVLTVKVTGSATVSQPDLSAIKAGRARFLDDQTFSYFSMGAGQPQATVARIFNFEVAPANAGSFAAGPVTVTVDGRPYSVGGPVIEVTGVQQQDDVIIRISASRDSALVNEPFEVALSVSVRRLEGAYTEVDPLDPNDPPALSVPFLDGQPVDGLTCPDVRRMLQERLQADRSRAGFAVNNYTYRPDPFDMRSMFDMDSFFQDRKAKFSFDRRTVEQGGKTYFEYSLRLPYVAKQEGTYTFGPAVFKGKIIGAVDAQRHGMMKDIFTVGPACTVRVVPPPERGRPPSYVGAIGSNIVVEATLDTQTCNVGDPLKLALSISGDVTLDNVFTPPLWNQASVTKLFRLYQDTVQTSAKGGRREYVYTLRPTQEGNIEVPPLEISYYDSNERAYRTVTTRPIPVRAHAAHEVRLPNFLSSVTNRAGEGLAVAMQDNYVPAPVTVDRRGADPFAVAGSAWLLALGLAGPAAFSIAVTARGLRRLAARRAPEARQRRELKLAMDMLREARRLSDRDPSAAGTVFSNGLRKYLAIRFGAGEAGLTPEDARRIMADSAVAPDLAAELAGIFERTFNAAFVHGSGADRDLKADLERARSLVETLQRTEPGRGRGGAAPRSVLSVALTLATCATLASAGTEQQRRFIWNEANAKMSSAQGEKDFLDAAAAYWRLSREGVRNGPLFYNMGTAFLMAKQYDASFAALLRAERYMGSTWEIRRNMELALAAGDTSRPPALPWTRVPLAWHYGIGLSARVTVAICAFALFWGSLTIGIFGLRNLSRPLIGISLAIFVLFGSSVATTLHAEFGPRAVPACIREPRADAGRGIAAGPGNLPPGPRSSEAAAAPPAQR